MVFSVSDEARVGGQEMTVQELPCLVYMLCSGLGRGWREGTTNLGPEHRPLQPVAPPSSVFLSSYLLQAHSEIQGPLAVGKWRLRTVERVCRSVGGLQTNGVGPLPAPLRRHLFPHQCAAGESPKIPILLTQGPDKQASFGVSGWS